jgi:lysophospholipase L1-like esterase
MGNIKLRFSLLIAANIITLTLLLTVSFYYKAPQSLLAKMGIIKSDLDVSEDANANASNDAPVYNNPSLSRYEIRSALFSVYDKTYKYKIVMLGDSITEGAEWNELLGIDGVANRGVYGDITQGIINRLENVIEMEPEICFIMAGINDLSIGIGVEETLKNYDKIAGELSRNNIDVVVQSTLYIANGRFNWKRINENVDKLNNGLKEMCDKNNFLYVDVNGKLSGDGALNEEYTYDGIHLSGGGYKKWAEALSPIIEDKIGDKS